MRSNHLTTFIVIGLVVGIAAGYLSNTAYPEDSARFAELTALLPGAFLRLIKMIISPLVFTTLVVGIAKMEDIRTVGRIGGKALGWFIFASIISLTIGLLVVGFFEPGRAMQLAIPADAGSSGIVADGLSLQGLISHAIPTSILDAMARNEILQIVVFALFFGVAMAALGERTRPIVALLDSIAHIMLKVTGYVMIFAPLAVFGAMASIVAKEGLGVVRVYGIMVGEFYIGIALL
jgi:Na+/H+-dicarboxylate symporter